MGARAETSVRDFIQAQEQPQRFYYFQTVFKGAPWHVVVYGQYADRAAATNAVASLPESLRKLRPWARSIAGVKADIRKKYSATGLYPCPDYGCTNSGHVMQLFLLYCTIMVQYWQQFS